MEYQEILCKFCKECKEPKIIQSTIKATDKLNSDTVVIKCANFCPKYHFEDKGNNYNYCPFLVDMEDDLWKD